MLFLGLLVGATLLSIGTRPAAASGWIGISVQDVTHEIGEAMGLPAEGGALVSDVVRGGPAEGAGLHAGDVITQVDSEKVAGANDLVAYVGGKDPGTQVTLHVMRDKEEKTIAVRLAEAPPASGEPSADRNPSIPSGRGMERGRPRASVRSIPGMQMPGWRLGVRVNPLDRDLAPYFQTEPGHGVLVVGIVPGSPAVDAGILSGDVILKVNGEEITDPVTLRNKVGSVKEGESFAIDVLRKGRIKQLRGSMTRGSMTDRMPNPAPGSIQRPHGTVPPSYGWNQRREMVWGHNQLQMLERQMRELERKMDDLSQRLERFRQDRMR
jgi:membrane-associated protease RseP (regulator of RpoE activity)